MEGPFEAAGQYAPRVDAAPWQATTQDVAVVSHETQSNVSAVFSPPPMQQQPEMRQLEQQQQMRKADDPVEAPVQKTREELQREYERALAWVKVYEPDRLW